MPLALYVILFDIDGTLISSSVIKDVERRRYLNAIRDVVGEEPLVVPARFAGMVDPQICRILLGETGLTEADVEYFLPMVLSRMCEIYVKMDKMVESNSGVRELLSILARSPRHVVGVLSGNLSAVAAEKLAVAGIQSYFTEGFYADNYFDRTSLMKDAVQACVSKYQLTNWSDVMMVGDTPRDIAAANEAEATSIGIATSTYSMAQLRTAHPKWVFPSLEPTEHLLKTLGLR